MGLDISKCYSYSFHLMTAKLHVDMATMVEYTLLLFLAISQVLKFSWYFKICNILKRLIVERNG